MKKIVLILLLTISGMAFSQIAEKSNDDFVSTVNSVNAYPNPFKTKTSIFFAVNNEEEVSVTIQNILGKVVFFKRIKAHQGKNAIVFFKDQLSEGVYVYTVATKNEKISKRLVIK